MIKISIFTKWFMSQPSEIGDLVVLIMFETFTMILKSKDLPANKDMPIQLEKYLQQSFIVSKSQQKHTASQHFSCHVCLHGSVDIPHCLLVQICLNSRIPCQNSSPKRCRVTPASRMQCVVIILQTCTKTQPLISASYAQTTPMANPHSCLDASECIPAVEFIEQTHKGTMTLSYLARSKKHRSPLTHGHDAVKPPQTWKDQTEKTE